MDLDDVVPESRDVILSDNVPVAQSSKTLSIETLISQAIDKGLDVATMERLLAMAERLDAKHAEKAYFTDFAEFQYECPIIQKHKPGAVAKYAPIEDVIEEIRHLLRKYGFSYSFDSETFDDRLTVYCTITHREGHSVTKHFTAHHLQKNKAISGAQLDAGTLTFTKRYAMFSALGLWTRNEDQDGYEEPVAVLITQAQIERLRELLSHSSFTEAQMLKSCGVETIEAMTGTQATTILTRLEGYARKG